jgi:hypothetical protein
MKILIFALIYDAVISKLCYKLKPEEAPCTKDHQCSSNWCENAICKNLPEFGQECTKDYRCGPYAGCSADGICELLPKMGEPCMFSKKGQNVCDEGLLCYDGICDKPRGVNSSCSDDRKCGHNLRCRYNLRELKLKCIPKLDLNQLCIKSDSCLQGSYCFKHKFPIGKCTSRVIEGAKCSKQFQNCMENLDCSANQGYIKVLTDIYKPFICKKPPSANEPCGGKCKSGNYCGLP